MTIQHIIEYSRSGKATCQGAACAAKGRTIDKDDLRYGQSVIRDYTQTVDWRHWDCVTPEILSTLASLPNNSIPGIKNLRAADQQKIKRSIVNRKVDAPASIPASQSSPQPIVISSSPPQASSQSGPSTYEGPSQNKRKLTEPLTAPGNRRASFPMSSQVIDIDDEEEEHIEEEVKDELYCVVRTTVVGIQHYHGLVGEGENVLLVRQPANPYDRNAIQVMNIGGSQVGHLPRDTASRLAPLLDVRAVTVEGVMITGNLARTGYKKYTLDITLRIYGPSDRRAALEPKLIWATPNQRGFAPTQKITAPPTNHYSQRLEQHMVSRARLSRPVAGPSANQRPAQTAAQLEAIRKQQEALKRAAELKDMLATLEKVDDDSRRVSLLDNLLEKDDVLNLPLYPNPPGVEAGNLVVDLLPHQSQALQWCMDHEHPVLPKRETDKPVQFWDYRKNGTKPYYFNMATHTPQTEAPVLGRGGLCADAMGLGKTLTMISLILATQKEKSPGFSKTTLIVCPVSVLSNWEKQILDHCVPGKLSYAVYYGNTRSSYTAEDLKSYDIVITSYQTVTSQHLDASDGSPVKKKAKIMHSLFEVQWKRIILDEGHIIRNPRTKAAKAASALSAERRWVLTGTPIINSPRDLGSLLTFLKIAKPLDNEDFFKRLLLRPLKNGDVVGAELLRALMSQVCIRRTKEMQHGDGTFLVPLPAVEMMVIPVKLDKEARAFYDEVEALSKHAVQSYYMQTNRDNQPRTPPASVLSLLTRMRQIALHPGLVPASYLEDLRANNTLEPNENPAAPQKLQITAQEKMRLQILLASAIENSEECPICFDLLIDPRITSCAHTFCLACITESISRDPKCPMDRRAIDMTHLIEPAPETELTQAQLPREEEDENDVMRTGSSAKIDQLVSLLSLAPANDKVLVFSQFTTFLDKIAEAFDQEGISYVQFDGTMSQKKRQDTIARFSVPLKATALTSEGTPISKTRKRSKRVSYSVGESEDGDSDDDFVMNAADAANDDNFIASDDDLPFPMSSQKTKSKAKGKGKAKAKPESKAKARASFGGDENPRVMLISLKAGALGLNLTVANHVVLCDPWWQEGIESQAIDRCNRIGQKKKVHVYQLISEDTVESKVLEIQERKKTLIQQAFSGITRKETVREKKEARMKDLIELFGMNKNNGGASE